MLKEYSIQQCVNEWVLHFNTHYLSVSNNAVFGEAKH